MPPKTNALQTRKPFTQSLRHLSWQKDASEFKEYIFGTTNQRKRLDNDLDEIQLHLTPFRDDISGIVVESTYSWYWLVDGGLMDKGYPVHLANKLAIQQYNDIKYTNDATDPRFLAHLLRLKIYGLYLSQSHALCA